MTKKPQNNGEKVDGLSSDDWDRDASPMLATKMEHKNEAAVALFSARRQRWWPVGG